MGLVPWPLIAVAETASYLAWAKKVLGEEERSAIVDLLAANPTCGALLGGTGGVRKIRFARRGAGKSGGVRVIYYFHDVNLPVYVLAGFAKNEKANLSARERAQLRRFVDELREERRSK
ncbi:MAG: type II toxin-antitoxin system RelE/ParE family toxin [Deltaproteobacteria bacterium]|nr:type II toxin-antitoxin system RelE/ParE family toxin [Deltaproteobacteria bacterium]